MRAVVQRALQGNVTVEDNIVGEIGKGLVVLVGISNDDDLEDVEYISDKIANLRIFDDEEGKMNLSIIDVGGEILLVSQFTLLGDVRKGRRPNYMNAAKSEKALYLFDMLCNKLSETGLPVKTGKFGAMMQVSLINDGPVTILLDSKKVF
ncbi:MULTISPECIES: D-aminoacyl-tRNA deacylase [Thermoanaerobacterium]|uniref:D-aminoacyl-tRNA deacylase n=2 Tax=Thermoanaerobacterium TaxID=28895 RepID=W9E8W6_9THEO|nr:MULTISPECIES: D-aminoacyl-tRNA deacylase [Thermoanaerobacterium]AFK86703.1 D-tyrosyl-tRNA(Tyr) deacylase [Thermoanaerobacterium saccharolyticum JW/SL-YS485]ETO38282.1 D-tyrosyl-tRNA(Tyr) deacylase [Thermoanaerobacterium aotearoense SCUT27]